MKYIFIYDNVNYGLIVKGTCQSILKLINKILTRPIKIFYLIIANN